MVDIWPPPSSRQVDLAEEPAFDIGVMRVLPAERAVVANGERHELQPRIMQVLVALAKSRPEVVSRDKLIQLCWEGRIVGDDALNRCILALRHLAQEITPPPFAIETVPRIGHRLVEAGTASEPTVFSKNKPAGWRAAVLAAALLAVLLSGLFVWMRQPSGPASIDVLPFRDLSKNNAYFADGLSEEILGRLAREPAFRVAGRASTAQFTAQSDPKDVRQKLHVDYILEGSVRTDGGRVRINASLVRTRDGMRLWSDTYERRLADTLQIEAAIGEAVASGLKRRLIQSPLKAINGEAYALYLNARGLLRSANPQSGHEAVMLLQQAVRIDPNFAPAWSSLAEALLLDGRTKGPKGLMDVLPTAQAAAVRALRLDPNLGQAHAVLSQILGTETPEAVAHLRRAAELEPRTAEGQISGALAAEISGNYEAALAGLRLAQKLDPLSPLPVRALIGVTTVMGDRQTAEAVAAQSLGDDRLTHEFALARIAWFSGDISDAARRWAFLARQTGTRWASGSKLSLEDSLFALKLSSMPPSRPALPTVGSGRFGPATHVLANEPPTAEEWGRRNSSAAAALVYYDENLVSSKLMLNAGRARELVATYDSPTGLLGIRRGRPIGPCQLDEATIVALGLRGAGRNAEADALLREADRVIENLYSRGRVPTWVDSDAAAVWAAQGKVEPAMEALDRALRRGSVHAGRLDLPDLADEPAFRGFRNNARFKTVLERYRAHLAKERQETAQALNLPA